MKRYLDEQQGRAAGDVITDINPIGARANERTGYPTQKPIALLSRIIAASSNPGDVVLDPFCGCATACIAAQTLGRQWIGIDVEPKAVELCRQRLRDELGLFDETRELVEQPQRTDERQLELIPGRRQLRLELWRQLQAQQDTDDPACPECDRAPGIDYMEIDHIIPRSLGGEHSRNNVQLLCGPCNRSKGGRTMRQWRRAKAQAVKSE